MYKVAFLGVERTSDRPGLKDVGHDLDCHSSGYKPGCTPGWGTVKFILGVHGRGVGCIHYQYGQLKSVDRVGPVINENNCYLVSFSLLLN